MYSNEEKAILLAKQAGKLGVISLITFLIPPISWVCCIDGYYKAKKAKTLTSGNRIVESECKLVNIMRWVWIIFFIGMTILPLILVALGYLS